MAGKQVAKKEETAVADFNPAIFEADAQVGLKNLDQEDMALPFLKIVSGLDPILDEREDVRKGDIVNTVTGEVYKGKDGIRVIPCAYQRKFIQWSPRGTGSGAPSHIFNPGDEMPKVERDPNDNKEYLVDGSGDYLEQTAQWYVKVLTKDGTTSALIAMKSTQLKKSRKWMSMIASREMQGANGPFTPPMFSHIYLLKTISEENSKGSWHGWEMSLEGPISDANMYKSAKDFNASIEKGEVQVKHTQDGAPSGESDNIPFSRFRAAGVVGWSRRPNYFGRHLCQRKSFQTFSLVLRLRMERMKSSVSRTTASKPDRPALSSNHGPRNCGRATSPVKACLWALYPSTRTTTVVGAALISINTPGSIIST